MTPERLATITARHEETLVDGRYKECAWCGDDWPCDAIQILTAYEQAQRRLAWLEAGAEWWRHDEPCPMTTYRRCATSDEPVPCTCGFDQWLAAEPKGGDVK